MSTKQRLSASVDAELLEQGHAAVRAGRADSLSAWVNDGLRLKAEHDQRMQAMDTFLAAYEAEHGVITESDMAEAERWARAHSTVVRGRPRRSRKTPA
jgi:hypothetical protein